MRFKLGYLWTIAHNPQIGLWADTSACPEQQIEPFS
jgi:hypothetical protein